MIYAVLKDFAAPVATIIAAFSAVTVTGYFAFQQWNTAREKLLLDLFDKRFTIYHELRSVVWRFVESHIVQPESFNDFTRATLRAQFLFGPKVMTFLDGRRMDLLREMVMQNQQPQEITKAHREKEDAERVAAAGRLGDFFKDFDELVAPYMSHHQKALNPSSTCRFGPSALRQWISTIRERQRA